MARLAGGTLTFLFTDIERSTRLWERHPEAMQAALARHDAILEQAIGKEGDVFKRIGDAFCAAFADVPAALDAALAIQRALQAESWGETGPLRVRIALHTGPAEQRNDDYFGTTLNRVARILVAGHGGQTLLSSTSAELMRDHLPTAIRLRDLGERRLRDLSGTERIFQLVAPDLPTEFLPLRTLDARANNLPAQLTALLGREPEVAAACALLRQPDVHLLTLTGPGGTGKTRLSLQIAADMLDDFEHGVYFVPLAPISDPTLVASAISAALEVREVAGKTLLDTLKEYLHGKQMLLVLDNFEQVVEAAPLVSQLLSASPKLKVMVSSRTALRVYGEHEFAVPPLPLPDLKHLPPPDELVRYPVVALFAQRAHAIKSDFILNAENTAAVAEICVRLDGLPLAIELAAARIKLLPPQAMLARLSNRLALLTSGLRDLPARQQTLRGAIDWSYDLLNEAEKRLFAHLSVFVGGGTLEAVEVVCLTPDPDQAKPQANRESDGLEALIDQSLLLSIIPTPISAGSGSGGSSDEPRFIMLETLREYALEKLAERAEQDVIRNQHADYYTALAETAEPELTGKEQKRWLARLEADHDNIRAALAWLLEYGRVETALRLAGALWRFWYVRGYVSEGRTWLTEALAQGDNVAPSIRAKALNGAGNLAWMQIDQATARQLFGQSLAIQRQLGDKLGIARVLSNLGNVFIEQGDYAAAAPLYQESLAIDRELGDKWGIANDLNNLGIVFGIQGDLQAARAHYAESLAIGQELGDKLGVALALEGLASLASRLEQPARAAQMMGAAAALCESIGAPLQPVDLAEYDITLAAIRSQLDEAEFDKAWTAGRTMTLEQAVEYTLNPRG